MSNEMPNEGLRNSDRSVIETRKCEIIRIRMLERRERMTNRCDWREKERGSIQEYAERLFGWVCRHALVKRRKLIVSFLQTQCMSIVRTIPKVCCYAQWCGVQISQTVRFQKNTFLFCLKSSLEMEIVIHLKKFFFMDRNYEFFITILLQFILLLLQL